MEKKVAEIMKETRVEMEGKGEKGIREENGKGEKRREFLDWLLILLMKATVLILVYFTNKTEQKDILKLLTQGY